MNKEKSAVFSSLRSVRTMSLLLLIVLLPSALLYALNLALFKDFRNLGFYTLMDLAFLPIQAILVSVVLEAFLSRHEAQARVKKLGMVSGAFFSEVGDGFLKRLSLHDTSTAERRELMRVGTQWKKSDFIAAANASRNLGIRFSLKPADFAEMSAYLSERRDFLLRLLENPLLLDHELLTDSLMAVFHAHDELRLREDFGKLPESDKSHLAKDLERAYSTLIEARLLYLAALKSGYPFLYSLALRADPLSLAHEPTVLV